MTWNLDTGTIYDDEKRRAGSNHVDPIMFCGMITTFITRRKSRQL